MKLIDYSTPSAPPGVLEQLFERLQALLPFWPSAQKGHEQFVAQMQGGMDNRFFMLKNVQLPDSAEVFPYILVGPTGVVVLNTRTERGIYRARGESWWELSKTSRQYQPAHYNLIRQSQNMAQHLAAFLTQPEYPAPTVLPVLVFVDPGVHIEPSLPAVRIVLADGIKRLASNLLHSNEVLSFGEVRRITDLIEQVARPVQTVEPPDAQEDFFGKELAKARAKNSAANINISVPELNLPPVVEKLGLSRKQWVWVAILAVFTMLVLGFLIVFVLLTA